MNEDPMEEEQRESIHSLIERSSLGSRDARRARARVSPAVGRAIAMKARGVEGGAPEISRPTSGTAGGIGHIAEWRNQDGFELAEGSRVVDHDEYVTPDQFMLADPPCPIEERIRPSWGHQQLGGRVSKETDRHVVPNPDGGWDVKRPGAGRASTHHDTQADAQRRAREIVHNAGGGEVVIHGRDGKIRDSDTVAPGRDPNPPKDRK